MTTERKPVRTDVTPADMDPQGNVVVWDHGPSEPPAEIDRASPEYQALVADANAWHKRHGDGPVPLTMHASDAGHAITADPDRYALEPLDLDDSEIEAEVKAIQERRAEAEKFAADQKAEVQYMADRKVAIATLHARHLSDEAAKEAEVRAPKPRPPASTAVGVHRDALEQQDQADPEPDPTRAPPRPPVRRPVRNEADF